MLFLTIRFLSLFSLLALSSPSARPQETRWHELTAEAQEFSKEGKFADAITAAQEALRIAETTFGLAHPNVASSLNDLGQLYDQQARYGEAEPLYKRALAIREKALGTEHSDVAALLSNLAWLYVEQGRYSEAEPLYKRAVIIQEKALGPDSLDLAGSLNDLALLYADQARYGEAQSTIERSLAIKEKAFGAEHPDVATSLANLGTIYGDQGRYREAEPLYKRALAIDEKALGPEDPNVATALNNLADLYRQQGRYAEAEPLAKRSLAIREKVLGSQHPDVAQGESNLGLLYANQGRYREAEPLYRHALVIDEKTLGPQHPTVSGDLNNLAAMLCDLGRFSEAEPFLKRALEIEEKALGREHPDVAGSLNNLAALYTRQGNNAEAEPLYERSLAIAEKAFGSEHPYVGLVLDSLAQVFENEKLPQEAAPYYARSLAGLSRQFDYYFSYMTEKDRLAFLKTVSYRFPEYFNFCLNSRQQLPDLPGKMYDVILWEKGFIAQSVAAVRAQIEAGGDKEALALLDQLTSKKTQLAHLLDSPLANRDEWRKQIEQLEHEANDLEKELVKRSAALGEQKKLAHVSWRDVQKALNPGEAAVEFVRFPYYDGKKLTNTNYCVALVVTPESSQPSFIVLVDAKNPNNLEKGALRNYRQNVGLQQTTRNDSSAAAFYDVFWKPLEPNLEGSKRVYLSPDGALNQVSLAVVPDSNGKILIERYDLRVLNSTKDLLREKHDSSGDSAVLIGNPAFTVDAAKQREAELALQKNTPTTATAGASATATPSEPSASASATASASAPADAPAPLIGVRGGLSRDFRGGALEALPATQIELQSIDSLLEKQNWRIQLFTGQNALKDSVKRVQHPRVLHIATHGFFEPDQTVQLTERAGSDSTPAGLEDPMLRSGLFFAGANRTLAGEPAPPDLDDGVLTAYEATGLNLQGTELVVLSACETGLGEVSSGEGVFGLRRALQVAGADSVLLSMWSVPDKETQELMTLFYSNWLAGQDKPTALRNAQLELRKTVTARYGKDSPFYWGAFVLVGR